jgi:hypothetical protein
VLNCFLTLLYTSLHFSTLLYTFFHVAFLFLHFVQEQTIVVGPSCPVRP